VSVSQLLADKRVCVCGGSGGVGKTTVSAAIALGMAAEGAKVAVVTIDPAKRLANALGLRELDNEPCRVAPEMLGDGGKEAAGLLRLVAVAEVVADEQPSPRSRHRHVEQPVLLVEAALLLAP